MAAPDPDEMLTVGRQLASEIMTVAISVAHEGVPGAVADIVAARIDAALETYGPPIMAKVGFAQGEVCALAIGVAAQVTGLDPLALWQMMLQGIAQLGWSGETSVSQSDPPSDTCE